MTSNPSPRIVPEYERSPKAGVFTAVFPDARLRVEASRARSYPILRSSAPDTRALYRGAAAAFIAGGRVLDLGAGSGAGAHELREQGAEVTLLDSDREAVNFASAHLPGARVIHHKGDAVPAALCAEAASFDGICIVDVLGQARVPARVARLARRLIGPSGRLFLAEPRAYPAQGLQAPVLRAFSPTDLRELMLRTGFEVESWFDTGHFVSLLARPSEDADWTWLESGESALARGQVKEALEAYRRAADGSQRLRGEALLGCAAAHVGLGQIDAACQCLMDAARSSSTSGRALAGLAQVAELAGESTQALALAIQALEREPCDRGAVMAMAAAAEAVGESDTFGAWRMANGLQPADPVAAIALARAAAGRGELGYAIWVLERLRDFGAELGAAFHETLSWLYLTAERVGEARLEAEIARVKAPDSAGVVELWAHLDSLPLAS